MKAKRVSRAGRTDRVDAKFGDKGVEVAAVGAKAGSNWKALAKSLKTETGPSSPSSSRDPVKSRATKRAGDASAPERHEERGGQTHSDEKSSDKWGAQPSTSKAAAATNPPASAPSSMSRPWFADDLNAEDLALATAKTSNISARAMHWEGIMNPILKRRIILDGPPEDVSKAKKEPGNYLAVDCEMVGVGPKGSESHLARVSIVNFHGALILDRYARPIEKVTDYRTWVSGIRPRDLKNAPPFSEVQAEVADLIKGKVLVGHAIQNDLKALMLSHPRPLIRDTADYQGLRDLAQSKMPSLKTLAKLVLGIEIQVKGRPHSSVEDARATMTIFRTQKAQWDESLRRGKRTNGVDNDGRVDPSVAGGATTAGGTRKNPSRIWQPPSSSQPKGNGTVESGLKRTTSASAPPSAGANKKIKTVAHVKAAREAKSDWWKDDLQRTPSYHAVHTPLWSRR